MGRDAGLHGSAEALPQMEPVGDLQQGPGCALTGGEWYSPYDDKYFTDARTLDIDHLAEAWDSGASAWTAKEREAYANDLGDDRALITVSAAGNSSKADQDPSTWQPPAQCYRCQYAADGVADRSGGPGHRPHRICRTRRGPQQLPRPARHRHPRTIPRGPRPSSGVRGSGFGPGWAGPYTMPSRGRSGWPPQRNPSSDAATAVFAGALGAGCRSWSWYRQS